MAYMPKKIAWETTGCGEKPKATFSMLLQVIELSVLVALLYITDFSFYWIALPVYLAIATSWGVRLNSFLRWRKIRAQVSAYIPPHSLPTRKFLILVNPYGGSKMGVRTFEDVVKPMFEKASANYDYIMTTHATHAFELGSSPDIFNYTVVATISGDGMMSNLLNGIAKQSNGDRATMREKFNNFALGIIPAGTSNGLAESLGWSDPYKAVKGLIENDVKFLDAFEITTLEGAGDSHSKTRWDLHSVNWAYTADVDYVLEHQSRWLPKWFRDIYVPIYVMLLGQSYMPKVLSFRPEQLREEDRQAMYYDDLSTLPDDPHPSRKGWKMWDKIISMCYLANTPVAATGVLMAPHCKLNEACFDLAIVWDMSVLEEIILFLHVDKGDHIKSEKFHLFKCKELFLATSEGKIDSSGELLDASTIHVVSVGDNEPTPFLAYFGYHNNFGHMTALRGF